MPVRKEPSGRRSVSAEVEVTGTPEEVWRAIATGPGISSWFVPAEVDGRVGGRTICHFGPGDSMDSVATITEWQPPNRFMAETEEGPGTVATEWIVEARSGATCVVRVVHSWFAEGDDWDAEFEGHSGGWLSFFKILRFYLEHFSGEPAALAQAAAQSGEGNEAAWERLAGPLGLRNAQEGQAVSSSAGAPPMNGVVLEAEYTPEGCSAIVRMDDPVPALAHLIGFPMGGASYLSVRLYLYGADAQGVAASVEERWQGWLAERFPTLDA